MSLEHTGAYQSIAGETVADYYRAHVHHGRAMLNDHEWLVQHFGEFWYCSGWFDDVRVVEADALVAALPAFVVKCGRPRRKMGLTVAG